MSGFGSKADISRAPRSVCCPRAHCKIRLLTLIMTLCLNKQGSVMGKDRLAAFSDGVIAIIITIMVLELKVPHGSDWTALMAVTPNFVSYVLSFIYLAIYWNNHHHLLHTVTRVDGLILWANSFLLFWLSLIPAATAWMGENFLVPIPTALYGGILLMPAIAYYLLQKAILRKQGPESLLANALGTDIKGKISPVLYAAAILLAFVSPWISIAIYVMVAVMWLVPDRRIESVLREKSK
jgi:TMEM175 potassium channel family protein